MEAAHEPELINGRAARSFCDSEPDLAVRQLLEVLLTALTTCRAAGEVPDADVDLLFVMRAARPLFLRRELLSRILQGVDHHWFPESGEDGLAGQRGPD